MTDPAPPSRGGIGNGLPGWARVGLMAILVLTGIFALGASAGIIAADREDGFTFRTVLLLALMAYAVAICAWGAWRLYPTLVSEPEAPRVRTSRTILWVGGAVGGVLGLMLSLSTDLAGGESLFSNGPIPPGIAVAAIVGWIFGGFGLTFAWLRTIDEHEMQANNAGALAGLCTYLAVEPAWWLGARGGFLPEQQPMLTFLLVLTVYTAVWFWRRSR